MEREMEREGEREGKREGRERGRETCHIMVTGKQFFFVLTFLC
jgi:hypothetical protein